MYKFVCWLRAKQTTKQIFWLLIPILQPKFDKHCPSIVCIGVSTPPPPSKTPPPLSCQAPLKSANSPSPPPLKVEILSSPPFWNFVWRFNPPPLQQKGGGGCTLCLPPKRVNQSCITLQWWCHIHSSNYSQLNWCLILLSKFGDHNSCWHDLIASS